MRITEFALKIFVCILPVLFSTIQVCFGQSADSNQLHYFSNRRGIPLTVGHLKTVDDENIVVEDGNGNKFTIPRSSLSKNSQAFTRKAIEQKSRFLKAKSRANEIAKKLAIGSKKVRLTRIAELEDLSKAASQCDKDILNLAQRDEDIDLRKAAFRCYLGICEPNNKSLDLALLLIKGDTAFSQIATTDTNFFFQHLNRFGSAGQSILIHAAYTGTLRIDYADIKLDPFKVTPKTLATTSGRKNYLRAHALFSLSQMHGSAANHAALETFKAAEKEINGKIDYQTLRAIFAGWASSELYRPNCNTVPWATMKVKYAKHFPIEIKTWVSNQKRNQQLSQTLIRLQKLSKMRNFEDRNGEFLTRGNLVNLDQDKAVIATYLDKTISINFLRLSNKDQAWVENQSKN